MNSPSTTTSRTKAWILALLAALLSVSCLIGCQETDTGGASGQVREPPAQTASATSTDSATSGSAASTQADGGASSAASSQDGTASTATEESSSSSKAKLATTPRIAVCALEKDASKDVRKWMKKCGYKVFWINNPDTDPADYDGLIIPGGSNMTPSVYGAEPDPHTYGCNLENDELQIGMVRKFAEAGKPILGICRGMQVVNVTFGGTLDQHIPGWHKGTRMSDIQEGSWLYDLFGDTEETYHSHHQCVAELGEGLLATEWDSEDGRIEALEHDSLPIYAIQWHPERMKERGVEVGKKFIDICAEHKAAETAEETAV